MSRFTTLARPLVLVALLAAAALVGSSPVGADVDAEGTSISVTSGGGGGDRGSGHGGGSSRPVYRDCHDVSLLVHLTLPVTGLFGAAHDVPTSAPVAWRSCVRIADGSEVGWVVGLGQPTPAPTATDLALAASSELALPLPGVQTSPPRGGRQLDGVPVWFWMDEIAPVSATATIPGLAATLTATPVATRYSITDGTELRCPDLGNPYDPGRPSAGQHSDCTHTFDAVGTFTVTATVDWELAWVSTDGESGTLPAIARATSFPLTLQEGQAVTD